ncbi:MAG: uroporphyrinogen decarboxylase family protein [Armatimonadota bacterium]
MTSKERLIAAWAGEAAEYPPLTTWCFGLPAHPDLCWRKPDGRDVRFWYSLRMEHLHTLGEPWELEDDFRRVLAWQSLGVDDLLDVSVPWSVHPEVTWSDTRLPAGQADIYPVLAREYLTPTGSLRHAIRQTGEDQAAGWVTQPACVPLIEDFNIPRAVEQAVSSPADIPLIQYLYGPPDQAAREWFTERMARVGAFAATHGVAVQAWSAFGMDAAVWLAGTEGAILLAMEEPEAFSQLMEIIAAADYARTELAAAHPGVDLLVERGWYSSTDFWSPMLFDRYVFPHLCELTALAHRHGKKFAYVMTTGVETLGPRLADAGVDVLYFVDPVQDGIHLERARELLSDRMTLVGGTNALTLISGDMHRIRDEVHRALDMLGPTNRFILHPVDALFPDTPWAGIEQMIAAWQEYR